MQSVTATFICCSSCRRPSTIRTLATLVVLAEIIEIVEHQVHIFLFLTLQMVNDSLVLVDFDPNVRICLSRNRSRLYKTSCFLVHIVATLSSRNIMTNVCIKSLLSSTHGLVIKLTTLLLKLVIAYIESITSKTMITHSHLVWLAIEMVKHLVIILVIVVDAGASKIVSQLNVVSTWLAHVQAVISLIISVSIGSVILVGVQVSWVASCLMLLWGLSDDTSTIIIEHCQGVVLCVTTHLYLTWVLKGQVLLTLALSVLTEWAWCSAHEMWLLFIVVMVRVRTMLCIWLLLLKWQLGSRLINILVSCLIFWLKIFIICWIEIEVLPSIQRATLVPLIGLWQLLLRWHIKITLCNCKLFHVALRVYILNALVNIVYGASVLLVLWLRQILKFCKRMLLVNDRITYQVLSGCRRASVTRLILVHTLRLSLFELLLVLVF